MTIDPVSAVNAVLLNLLPVHLDDCPHPGDESLSTDAEGYAAVLACDAEPEYWSHLAKQWLDSGRLDPMRLLEARNRPSARVEVVGTALLEALDDRCILLVQPVVGLEQRDVDTIAAAFELAKHCEPELRARLFDHIEMALDQMDEAYDRCRA